MQSILRLNEVGLLVVEEASTTTWNPYQASDTRQQVSVVEHMSIHRESGRVVRKQARQERVESAGPGEREVSESRCDRPFKPRRAPGEVRTQVRGRLCSGQLCCDWLYSGYNGGELASTTEPPLNHNPKYHVSLQLLKLPMYKHNCMAMMRVIKDNNRC
ncbi:hypothetical protein Pcinc_000555 [Petrolisthes cinctipes]|uniref:Uncharacterized protein n=1 Tax=Petrolisthes cinctipes TaxID=88211 RepID=A0AAE1GN74_PETCI|nr:hypothetical protein Pcinc_000555 [Petrolisthes cinctipes]